MCNVQVYRVDYHPDSGLVYIFILYNRLSNRLCNDYLYCRNSSDSSGYHEPPVTPPDTLSSRNTTEYSSLPQQKRGQNNATSSRPTSLVSKAGLNICYIHSWYSLSRPTCIWVEENFGTIMQINVIFYVNNFIIIYLEADYSL